MSLQAVGLDVMRARFGKELREFQKSQRKQMRKATNLMARKTRAKLRSGSPLQSGTGRVRLDSKGRRWGPLHRSIRTKVRLTRADLIGVVRYSRAGFYGRAHELGVNKSVTRRLFRRVIHRDGKFLAVGPKLTSPIVQTFQLRIPRRPVLEPVAVANASAAVEIIGDSYSVFTGGARVG